MNINEMRPPGPSKLAWNLVGARPQQKPSSGSSQNSAPLMSVQEQPVVTAADDHGEETGRKKKKKLSKSERLAKREQKALKEKYGPKDAHVSLISAADLRKFQQGSSSSSVTLRNSKKAEFLQEDFPSIGGLSSTSPATASISINRNSAASKRLGHAPLDDFPALGAAGANVIEEQESLEPEIDAPAIDVQGEKPDEAPVAVALQVPVDLEALNAPVAVSGKKKSKKPIVITLDALLNQAKEGEKTKEKPVSKLAAAPKTAPKKTVGNLLDSTGPVLINRGKIREVPKNKKPTKLKKVILASRASRQNNENQELPETVRDDDTNQGTAKAKPEERDQQDLKGADSEEMQILREADELEKIDINSVVATAAASSVHNEVLIHLLNLALSEQTKVEASDKVESKAVEPASHPEELLKRIKSTMHSRKFRPYCDMYLTKELHGHVMALLKELHRFQDRLYHTDPMKYQLKRRYVHGIKNVLSYLQINKVVLVIMAPDIEPSAEAGGLDDQISAILSLAKERNVPVVFSGNRYILGKPIFIKTPVSSIAILNKSGADEIFKTLLDQAEVQRTKYQEEFLQRVRSEAKRNQI